MEEQNLPEDKKKKKKKAIYASISNEIGRSSKTIKCNKEMNIRVEFTEGERDALTQLTMTFKNNLDGTATLVIRGSKDFNIKDERQ